MDTSKAGKDLIKQFEAFRGVPYLCPADVASIGYGTTIYPNGKKVKLSDKTITQEEGDALFDNTLTTYEKAVDKAVTVPLTQNQFDACVSLCYNIGQTNFATSTLVKMLNTGVSPTLIALQFLRWDKARGVTLAGLTRRRMAESELFLGTHK